MSRTPPQALHWPVSESGVAPGRQIWPVIRWRPLSIWFSAVPCVRWFIPIVQSDIVAFDRANRNAVAADHLGRDPQPLLDRLGAVVLVEERPEVFERDGLLAVGEPDVLLDERPVVQPLLADDLRHRVQEQQVGPGDDGEVEVAQLGGPGPPGVDADQLGARGGRRVGGGSARRSAGWHS